MWLRPVVIVACAISGAVLAPGTGVAAQPRAGEATTADHRAAATRLRPVDPGRRVSVSIALRHDRRGLDGRLLTTPSRRASLRTIVRRHGATAGHVRAVVRWARARGLTARPGALRTRVVVGGPAGRMSRAFGVRLHHYRASAGRTYVAAPVAIRVPRAIAGAATGVAGLDHVPPPKHMGLVQPSGGVVGSQSPSAWKGCSTSLTADLSASGQGTAMTPFGIASAYGFAGIGAGASYPAQTVAIFQIDETYSATDLASVQAACRFGAGDAPVAVRAVNLPGAQTGVGPGEADLDAQWVASLAPAGTTVVVINVSGSSPTLYADFLERASALPGLTAVSISYGLAEMLIEDGVGQAPAPFSQANTMFQMLASSGVSVFAATGDQGSMGPPAGACSQYGFAQFGLPGYPVVNWPASAPGVTAVGGTMWNSTTRTAADETAWSETAPGWPCPVAGGGGGQSAIFPRPAWQAGAGAGVPGTRRLIPDVSLLAGQPGYFMVSDGSATNTGGTSASAPVLASAVLRMNAERMAAGRRPIGYLSPLLYGPLAGAIQDVTAGNTDIFRNGYCCTAGPGYDMASGLGAPNIGSWPALIP